MTQITATTGTVSASPRKGCPVCGGSGEPWHTVQGCTIAECTACGHRYVPDVPGAVHVSSNFGDDYFHGGKAGYPDYLGDAHLLCDRGRRYAKILSKYMSPGRVLDIGAAAGFILQGLVQSGWSGRGVEPNPSMAAYGRDTLGLQIDCAALETWQPGERFDVVAMLQSIMHFYDVRQACQVAADSTKPGGYWLIEAFDPRSFVGRVMGKAWHDYNPPSVLHWFSPGVLAQLVGQFGMEEVARGRAPKVISAEHAKSVLSFKLEESAAGRLLRPMLALVPGKLSIPYPGDDIFWALYRKRES